MELNMKTLMAIFTLAFLTAPTLARADANAIIGLGTDPRCVVEVSDKQANDIDFINAFKNAGYVIISVIAEKQTNYIAPLVFVELKSTESHEAGKITDRRSLSIGAGEGADYDVRTRYWEMLGQIGKCEDAIKNLVP